MSQGHTLKLGCAASPELHVTDPNALVGRPRRPRVDRKTTAIRTTKTEHTLFLATDQLDLPADLVAILYRYRWQVELFFRWFKTILRADGLVSLSQNGRRLVAYCALIVSPLLTLWTGRKPTKRTYEVLYLYLLGWAEEDEVKGHIARLAAAGD